MSSALRPWTQVAMPHDDVRDDRAVKAEYAVNLGRIDRGDKALSKHYTEPKAFFQTTYLTDDLKRLLSDVFAALGGKNVDRVLQLRTPFGGGKTHALAAMYHLAGSRSELGGIQDLKDLPNPGRVSVAVLPCADLTPGSPRRVEKGIEIRTLWGELAYRLGGAKAYETVRGIDQNMTAPGAQDIERILHSADGATLVLADEVLTYVERAMTVSAMDSNLGRQTLTFLQTLTETVAGDPKAVFVYALQASVAEAVGDEGLLQALDKLVGRVDARRVPVQDRQVREIIRRRLFKSIGDEGARTQVADAYAEAYRRFALGAAETANERMRVEEETRQFREDIVTCYPFHPSLIRLMYERWGSLPSYQRTRGALQFLGSVVHVLFKRGHGSPLIAPGDIPLDDPDVRSEFFRQVGEREKWDSVLDADVAGDSARAKRVDRRIGDASPALAQAKVGTTTATAITLYSFGARKDALRGVVQTDLVASCLRPGVEAPTADAALVELKDTLLHLHATGGRYRMDTIPSLTKLIEEGIAAVDSDDVTRRIRDNVQGAFGSSTSVIWPEDAGRIPDGRREFLMVYLPLEWGEVPPERAEAQARDLLVSRGQGEKGGKRRFRNGVGFVLPQKAHADQTRSLARRLIALELLEKRAKAGHVQVSAEQQDELREKRVTAAKDLDGACRGLYGAVLLPIRGKEGDDPIAFRRIDIGTLAATGAQVHERVVDLLKKQVYTDITVDRFVELVGVGGEDGPGWVPMGEALDAFFCFLDRPKLRSDAPLLVALAKAVADRRLGYIPGASVKDGKLVPDHGVRVRFGSEHGPDEFADETDAYLVAPAVAASLIPAPAPTPAATAGAATGPLGGAGMTREGQPTPVPKGTPGTRYVLRATAKTKQAWWQLGKALNDLLQMASQASVEVRVDATQPGGFDPVKLRNRVTEPLTEADGIEHDGVLGKE